jgi:hypothetical protein
MTNIAGSQQRFVDNVFYPEKERLMQGNDSVDAGKYDTMESYNAIRMRRGNNASFTRQARGLGWL